MRQPRGGTRFLDTTVRSFHSLKVRRSLSGRTYNVWYLTRRGPEPFVPDRHLDAFEELRFNSDVLDHPRGYCHSQTVLLEQVA